MKKKDEIEASAVAMLGKLIPAAMAFVRDRDDIPARCNCPDGETIN